MQLFAKGGLFCESGSGAIAVVVGVRHGIYENGARRITTICKIFSFADSCIRSKKNNFERFGTT